MKDIDSIFPHFTFLILLLFCNGQLALYVINLIHPLKGQKCLNWSLGQEYIAGMEFSYFYNMLYTTIGLNFISNNKICIDNTD